MQWKLAQRAEKMNPSVIREILKVTERPGIISFAGGLPSAKTFPVDVFTEASTRVLKEDGPAALQYGASEGLLALREQVAAMLPWDVDPTQVLITTGSQQGLDLLAKVLIDPASRVLVETPTYLGALQAFSPMEPHVTGVASDDEGVDLDALQQAMTDGEAPRFMYVLPNFQNPTGRSMSEARRSALVALAAQHNLPLLEDNPYGDLWFDAPPPAPLTARNPEGCVYLGSFSKVLAPGLRLGYLVAPKALYPKLLQAKQAADLHTPSFNQRVVSEVLKDNFLDRHVRRYARCTASSETPCCPPWTTTCKAWAWNGTARPAACSCGRVCPRACARSICCRTRWTRAWPLYLANRSTRATPIRARCVCRS